MRDDRGRGGRRFGGPDRGHDRGGPRGGRDEARPRDGSGDAKKPAEASTAESTEGDKK
jgi:hypothetical protein